jgi:hypothetical protein
VAADLHPKAGETTLRVAADLAARMDYDTGHVYYCLEGMMAGLKLSRATVARHVAYLRELGALAWVQHGCRANVRRAKGLPGYEATATVYAAVIPPVYDDAMGHQVVGSGYPARIVVDLRADRPASIPAPRSPEPVDNSPVDNRSSQARETPSLRVVKGDGKLKEVGGCNYIPRQRASRSKPRNRHLSLVNGRQRTARDVQRGLTVTRLVRVLVPWAQSVPLRRLEFVLRPWTDQGRDAHLIAADLQGMCSGMRWRPKRPDLYISARIAADQAREQQLAVDQTAQNDGSHGAQPMANAEWAAYIAAKQRKDAEECATEVRTDAERLAARLDWNRWPHVIAHYQDDPDDAIDLYGEALCKFAIGQRDRLEPSEAGA